MIMRWINPLRPRDDGEGNAVRLALWNHPGDGIYGMYARCHRIVDRVEQLLPG